MPHRRLKDAAYRRSQRITLLGLGVNALLAVVKLLAGIFGHSYALVADACESLTDAMSSLIAWGGLVYAARPADPEHPYGHGKAESLITMFSALSICVVGAIVAYEAARFIYTPHALPAPYTLIVLIIVIVAKEALFWLATRVGQQTRSQAVQADAWHHRSDAITSLAALIGISIALSLGPGYEAADAWAALFGAAVILFNGLRLFAAPLQDLMDADDPRVSAEARRIAGAHPRIWGVEKVRARRSGLLYFIDMHIEVDPQMSVSDAHAVSHEIKDSLLAEMPHAQDVLIHIEPAPTGVRASEQDAQRLLW